MTQTLEERIEEFKTLYADLPKAKDALEIISELQEQNKAWQGMVESTCQTNKALCDRLKEGADAFYSQEKKLDEARQIGLDWMAIAKDREKKLDEALDMQYKLQLALESENCNHPFLEQLNKQGEAHDK